MVGPILTNIQVYSNSREYKDALGGIVRGVNLEFVSSDPPLKCDVKSGGISPAYNDEKVSEVKKTIEGLVSESNIVLVIFDLNFSKTSIAKFNSGNWQQTDWCRLYSRIKLDPDYDVNFAFRINVVDPIIETEDDIKDTKNYRSRDSLPKDFRHFLDRECIDIVTGNLNGILGHLYKARNVRRR